MADFYGPSADHWRSWLTVEVVDEGDTYATLRFRGGPQAESWGFDITSGITTTLRWTNDGGAHSGSGGLHSATGQSGWSMLADYTDTFQKHHDARTIDASAETVNASGWRNGTSTASGSIQIGARAHHTWSFDANGGSGAPGSVTKWVGEHGYMPTQAPTRGVGWKFAGWSTDKSAASATYSAGGECTDDSDLTFYAVWERTFLPPTVRVTDARRTGADGSADPFGDHGIASFSWSVDRSVDAGNAVTSLRLRHRKAGATDWAEESASASGASGTCSKLVAADTGSAYEVQCEVTDGHGLSSTATAVIPVATAPIDVGSYGASVGIGVAAPESPGVAIGSLVTPLPVSSGGTGATSLKAARKNLQITQGSKVCHGHGTAWVTLFESWAEFQSQTGCYDSARLPTLVTMNGDWGAFDGALSDCEIKDGEAVFVMARTTDGPHTLSSSNSVRINWICIW